MIKVTCISTDRSKLPCTHPDYFPPEIGSHYDALRIGENYDLLGVFCMNSFAYCLVMDSEYKYPPQHIPSSCFEMPILTREKVWGAKPLTLNNEEAMLFGDLSLINDDDLIYDLLECKPPALKKLRELIGMKPIKTN